jgi:phage terminase Nu1 subunit (DNA packaging protein)
MKPQETLQGNHAQTARLLSVSGEALRKMVKRGCPVAKKRGARDAEAIYDWRAVVAWRLKDAAQGRGDAKLTDARTSLAAAQARKVTRENAVADGDLVSIGLICAALADLVLVFRNVMLGLPTKLAPELIGLTDEHVAKAVVDRDIRHALIALSEFDPRQLPSMRKLARQSRAHTNGSGKEEP